MWSMTSSLLVVCLHLVLFSQMTAAECDKAQPTSCPAGCQLMNDTDGCKKCDCACQNVTCPHDQHCRLVQTQCSTCLPLPLCIRRECDQQQPSSCPTGCNLITDPAGCKRCDCACKKKTCLSGQVCRSIQVACNRAPCPTPPVCVREGECNRDNSTTCPEGCELVTDPEGCYDCNCACRDLCDSGDDCKLSQLQCFRDPCPKVPLCHPRECNKEKPTSCPEGCDLITDREGCKSCNCACRNMTCPSDEICKLVQVQCIRAPCPPLPTCVRDCKKDQPTSCPDGCELTTNREGCNMCNCACKNVTCPTKQVCKLVPVQCVRDPCPPQPQCVDHPGNQAELQTSSSIQMIILCLGAALAAWASGPVGLARRE